MTALYVSVHAASACKQALASLKVAVGTAFGRAQLTDTVAVPSPIEEEPGEETRKPSGFASPSTARGTAVLAVASPTALPEGAAPRGGLGPLLGLGLPPSPHGAAPEPRPFTPRPYAPPPELARPSADPHPNPASSGNMDAVRAGDAAALAAAGGGGQLAARGTAGMLAAGAGPPAALGLGWQVPGLAFGLMTAVAGGADAADDDDDAEGSLCSRSLSLVEVHGPNCLLLTGGCVPSSLLSA